MRSLRLFALVGGLTVFFVGSVEGQIQVTGFTPPEMSYLEGTPFTITGNGLSGPGLTVTVNGVEATVTSSAFGVIEGVAPSQLTAVSGPVSVAVDHLFGSPSTLLDAVTLVAPFGVSSFTPNYFLAETPGQWLTLSGSAFTPITDVELFHTGEFYDAIQVAYTDPYSIQVELPDTALGTHDLWVRGRPQSQDVVTSFPAALTFIAEMSLSSFPTAPVSYLGDVIDLTGVGFTPFTEVLIDGESVAVTFIDDNNLQVEYPPRPDATNGEAATVIVIDPVSGKDFFTLTYWATFAALTIDPFYVPAETSSVVTVTGSGFTAGTRVRVDEVLCVVNFIDHTQLEVTVPALPSGAYPVRVYDGIPDVLTVEEVFEAGLVYHVGSAPAVDSVVPAEACFAGGEAVTVHGAEFVPDTIAFVNGAPLLRQVVSRDGTRIHGRLPSGGIGPADVSVSDFRGGDMADDLFTYTDACPTLAPPTQIEATLAYGVARFRWTNPEPYEEIHVLDTDGALVAVLAGDATSYEEPVGAGDEELELSFQGMTATELSGAPSAIAQAFTCDYPPPLGGAVLPGSLNLALRGGVGPAVVDRCADTSGGIAPLSLDATQLVEGGIGVVIPGLLADIAEASKLRTGFTLTEPAERLEISGYYEKVGVAFGVSLRGRITQVFPPGGIDDEFTFPDPLLGDAKRWHSLTYYRADADVGSDPSASICLDGSGEPKLIPAGDYVLEIYAVGGDLGVPYYQFADDPRDVELLIEGTPCPPYPMVRVRDLSGFRTLPNVTGLKNEDAYELPSGKVRATFSARGTWIDEAGEEWSIDKFCDEFSAVGTNSSGGPSPTTLAGFVCNDLPQKTSPFHEYCWVIHAFEPPLCVVNRGTAGALTTVTLPDWGCFKVELTITDIACGNSRTFIDEIAVTPQDSDDCTSALYSFLYPSPDPSSIEVVVGLENPTPGFGEFDGDRPLDMRILVAPSCYCTSATPCASPVLDGDPATGDGDSFELRLAAFDGTDYHDLGAAIEVYDLCPDVVVGAKYFQVVIDNMTEIAASPHLVGYQFRDVYLQGRTLCYELDTGCFTPPTFPWFNCGEPMRMANPPTALYDSHWCGFYDQEAGAYRFSVTPTGDSEVFHSLASSPAIPFGIADAGLPAFDDNAIGAGFVSRFETQGGQWIGSIGTGSSSGHLLDNTLTGSAQTIDAVPGLVIDSGNVLPTYTWCRTETVFSQEFREELFRSIIYMGVIPPGIPIEIWGEVSLGLKFTIQSYLQTRLSPFAPLPGSSSQFEMLYALDSNVQISVPAGISVDIVGGLASVAIRLVPSAEFHLQPYVIVDASGVDPDYALETSFALGMEIEACIQTVVLGEQCVPTIHVPLVDDIPILPPYGNFQTPDNCDSGASTAGGVAAAGPTPTPSGLAVLSNPVAITSPDGTVGMTLWVVDGDTGDQIVEARITEGDEETVISASIPGFTAGFLFISPTAAFVDNDTILLAGMSRPGDFTPEAPPADVSDPDFFTIRNANVAYTEIRLGRIVRTGSSWAWDLLTPLDASDPLGTPTVDRRADGRPAIAGRATTGEAMVAWVRYQDDYLVDDGQVLTYFPNTGACSQIFCNNPEPVDNIRPQMEATSIAVRRVDELGPIAGTTIDVISDPGINVQPAIAYSPSGNVAYCVWVHDPTHTDLLADNTGRFLKGAIYDAVADTWTAPFDVVAIPDDYPGILEPAIALSSDDDGIVAFTAVAGDSPPDRAGLNGGSRFIYTARLVDGVFEEPVELRGACGERVYGWGPAPFYPPQETFAPGPEAHLPNPEIYMGWTEWGPPGTESGSGNVMLSCLEVGSSSWAAPMRLLPAGEAVVSNVAVTVVGGNLETAYFDAGAANPAAAPFGPVITGFKSTTVALEPDLAVQCELSNPFAAPGAVITGRAIVRNQGLTGSPVDDFDQSLTGLEVVLVEPDGTETIVDSIPLPFIEAGGRSRIPFTVEIPHDPVELRVRISPNPVDRDPSNDERTCPLGAPAPQSFACDTLEEPNGTGGVDLTITLEWSNPVVYDRLELYRNGMLLHTLPGRCVTFVDTTARALPSSYDLRGIVGASRSRKAHLDCDAAGLSFVRGDINADDQVNIADAVFLLDYLFNGGAEPGCFAAADVSFDGQVNIADAVNLLGYLFQQGAEPTAPFPDCGVSTAPSDETLGCEIEGC